MSIVVYEPLMVPAYAVRARDDEQKRDGSGQTTDVYPLRWMQLISVYSGPLAGDSEELVKIRVQGFVADHHIDRSKVGSECPASLALEATNWLVLVSGYHTFDGPFMSQVEALQRLTDAVLQHLHHPPTVAPLSPVLVLRRSAASTPLRKYRTTANGSRRRDRRLRVMPGDLVEVVVYLDVVVSASHGPCPRVSVFPAFDEVSVVKTAADMYSRTHVLPALMHAQIPSRCCECMCPGFDIHRSHGTEDIEIAMDTDSSQDVHDFAILRPVV